MKRAVPPARTGRTLTMTALALLASAVVVADWAASFARTGHVAGLRFTDVEYRRLAAGQRVTVFEMNVALGLAGCPAA